MKMVDQLPTSFFDLEERVKELYTLLPKLIIDGREDVQEDLRCSQCSQILIRAYGALCQHLFCGPCIRQLVAQAHPQCPLDREKLQPKKVSHQQKEKEVEKRVSRLKVHCPNHPSCTLIKPIIEILEHHRSCQQKQLHQFQINKEEEEEEEVAPDNNYVLRTEFTALKNEFETHKSETNERTRILEERIDELMAVKETFLHQVTQMQLKLDEVCERLETLNTSDHLPLPPPSKEEKAQPTGVWWRIKSSKFKTGENKRMKVMSEEFALPNDHHRFRAEIELNEAGGVDLMLKLLPSSDDETRHWPLNAKLTVAVYDKMGQDPARFRKTIPFNMERSVGRKVSALCVPSLLSALQLQRHFSEHSVFHMQLLLEIR